MAQLGHITHTTIITWHNWQLAHINELPASKSTLDATLLVLLCRRNQHPRSGAVISPCPVMLQLYIRHGGPQQGRPASAADMQQLICWRLVALLQQQQHCHSSITSSCACTAELCKQHMLAGTNRIPMCVPWSAAPPLFTSTCTQRGTQQQYCQCPAMNTALSALVLSASIVCAAQ